MRTHGLRHWAWLALVAAWCGVPSYATLRAQGSTRGAPAGDPKLETVVLAGGCFWGVQAVFEHVKGVITATSGYSGGAGNVAHSDMVESGTTGHAESVKLVFDPSRVSFAQLLKVFFLVVHDPTERNRQGPDVGSQYRSVIFYADTTQRRIANAYITQLNVAKTFPKQIVTQLVPLQSFYPAEGYHQDYTAHHMEEPYVVMYELPKIKQLREKFPELYTDHVAHP